jgi:curved DNA-binding protein CbpA
MRLSENLERGPALTKFRTHYDNLQISRSASLEVIKAAYRTLSAKYHPDRNRGDSRSAEIMSILNSSYAVLSDDDARRQHDAWIKRQEAPRATRPSTQTSAQAAQPDYRNPYEPPTWPPKGSTSDASHWSKVQSRSPATEAALAQGRSGKLAALIASATVACLLVFALISEQRARTRVADSELASAPATSVPTPSTSQEASEPVIWVARRRDEAPERAIEVATTFAKSEGLLGGKGYTVRIHDDGDAWLISYRSPAMRTAAAPIVLLDKESLRVIGYYAGGR